MAKYQLTVDGKTYEVEVGDVSTSPVEVLVNGVVKSVTFTTGAAAAAPTPAPAPAAAPAPAPAAPAKAEPAPTPTAAVEGTKVVAPMPGKILSVLVKVGQNVKQGDTVCTLEAMKMEMPISSTGSGVVKAVHVAVGQTVAYNDALVTLG
ncbi:MAG: biotin/lipoyl-containing protein [Anaerolineales bacterium]